MASALRAVANEHGVDVRHGAQFSPTGALGNHLRFSYAFYDDADIAEGVARLGTRCDRSADRSRRLSAWSGRTECYIEMQPSRISTSVG